MEKWFESEKQWRLAFGGISFNHKVHGGGTKASQRQYMWNTKFS